MSNGGRLFDEARNYGGVRGGGKNVRYEISQLVTGPRTLCARAGRYEISYTLQEPMDDLADLMQLFCTLLTGLLEVAGVREAWEAAGVKVTEV